MFQEASARNTNLAASMATNGNIYSSEKQVAPGQSKVFVPLGKARSNSFTLKARF